MSGPFTWIFIMTHTIWLCRCLLALIIPSVLNATPPVTLIIVIDQFSSNYIQTCRPYFRDGLKEIFDHGAIFLHAQHPHGAPGTGPGHATLSTGTTPNDHGIIGNKWYTPSGTKVLCDRPPSSRAAVFDSNNNLRNEHRTSKYLLCDTINDQLLLNPDQQQHPHVYALSLKSHAAIFMAGKQGHALWFDPLEGYFTSSTEYFERLPVWVTNFNETYCSAELKNIDWVSRYPLDDAAYDGFARDNYEYCGYGKSIISNNDATYFNQTPRSAYIKDQKTYELFLRTPAASALLIDLAKKCIDQCMSEYPLKPIVLWVSISTLDKVGHIFGPYAREAIDTLYHLDAQIGQLLDHIKQYIPEEKLLCCLTGDHGVMPIPELLAQQKYPARRINMKNVIKKINQHIAKEFAIEKAVLGFRAPQLFLNEQKLSTLAPITKVRVIRRIKKLLRSVKGVKCVWSYKRLEDAAALRNSLESHFKTQLVPGRSGRIQFEPLPYHQFTKHRFGTDHNSPYHYDTDVPLVICYPEHVQAGMRHHNVYTTQFAPTLARFWGTPKPSACVAQELPGIFE